MRNIIRNSFKIAFGMAALTVISQSISPNATPTFFQARAEQDDHSTKGCSVSTIAGKLRLACPRSTNPIESARSPSSEGRSRELGRWAASGKSMGKQGSTASPQTGTP